MSCTSTVLLSPNGCVLASPKPLCRFLRNFSSPLLEFLPMMILIVMLRNVLLIRRRSCPYGLIAVAAASSILLQVGKDAPARPKAVDYSGPSLSYYSNKFKPLETVQASAPSLTEAPPVVQQETMANESQLEEASSVQTASSN
ncbi:unnamed protein product [Eruca vesicaria subsp. sativa]|uniref:Uncharacterized protein n=1 Tax=Eruca vesicaria subsp. sativa TaxID=29727 RepID=A0ABC8LZ88_ERUVS|nr:unnamed protein product [Eruca vesicaria subsp. sativa]